MSIIILEDIDRESETSVDDEGRISRTHTETFLVESFQALSIPDVQTQLNYSGGMPHPNDPLTNLKSIRIKQLKHRNPWRWSVTIKYSNNTPDASEVQDDNPFNDPVKVRWEDGDQEVSVYEDVDGEPILNTNKRPFNPPVKALMPAGRLVIERNERELDSDPDLQYRKHVNANMFAGKEAGTLLLLTISSERDTRNGVVFYPSTYVFVWNPLGWNEEVLAADVVELDGDDWKPILDGSKQPITDPVPLDEDGAKIPPEDLPDAAFYKRVNKYPEANFAALRFPV